MQKDRSYFRFYLSEQDAERFRRAVARAGLTQKEYFRQLIAGCVPKDLPSPEVSSSLNELHRIEEAYRCLITVTLARGLDAKELEEQYHTLLGAIRELTERCYRPLPIREDMLPQRKDLGAT